MSDKSRDQKALEARVRELEAALARQQANGDDCQPTSTEDELTELLLQTNRTVGFSWLASTQRLTFSRHCRQVLGYTDAQYLNDTRSDEDFILSRMDEDTQTLSQVAIRKCIRTGKDQCVQLQLLASNGQLTWYELRLQSPQQNTAGKTQRLIGTFSDIHSLKTTELINEQKAATERWQRMLLRGLLEDDSDEVLQQTLAYMGEYLGLDYCSLRAIQKDTQDAQMTYFWEKAPNSLPAPHPGDVRLTTLPKLEAALKRGKPIIVTPDNIDRLLDPPLSKRYENLEHYCTAIIPLHYRGQPDAVLSLVSFSNLQQLDESQLNSALIIGDAMARAITRQRLHKTLTLRDERFAYALEASRDGLWDWDIKNKEIHLSKSYLHMLGYREGELSPDIQNFRDRLIFKEDLELCSRAFIDGFKNPGGIVNCEFRVHHKSGKLIWLYLRAKYVDRDSEGRPQRCVGINADITQFKATQDELHQAKAEAVAANQTKNEFLTRMSHEIRTPMNAIIGMGHLLSDTSLNQKQHDYLGNINDSAASLLHIIDEILDFSKLESGKFLLENSHFDLDEVYEKLSDAMLKKAKAQGVKLIFDVDHDVPRFIKGDARRLYQVLHNLLDNAVKFTSSGEIIVRSRKRQQHKQQVEIEFSVIDTGIGIAARDQEHLFAPFTQADGSSSRRFGGTGLGLTICRHLIDQMHGNIHVESEPGKGSCFSFTAQFDRSQLGELPMHHQPQRYIGLRTLIIDDHPAALAVLEKTATALKLNVTTATSTEEALTFLFEAGKTPEKYFELVLIDYDMPRINGLEACKVIRQRTDLGHQPKLVLISSHSREEARSLPHADTIDAFIRTPITPSRIFDAIAATFGETLFDQGHLTEPLSEQEQNSSLQGARVLLAEDNLINQKVAIGILKKKGVEVVVANNGLEVLTHLNSNPAGHFGAILMDMEMPEMDGYQATREVRRGHREAQIPIIAMTAHALQGDREYCLEAGMDDYITKPVDPSLLYSTLAQYLASHSHSG